MVLYVCTLFSALTFGFHQSQMASQSLDSVNEVLCGSGMIVPGIEVGDGHQSLSSDLMPTCPLCSSLGHGAALTALGWSLGYLPISPSTPPINQEWSKPAPRFTWPTLNPRAPPVASFATGLPS
jgi:hypothetical protein